MAHPVAERALAHFDELFPLHPRQDVPAIVLPELPLSPRPQKSNSRYQGVTTEKATGETYTPPALATFIAQRIVEHFDFSKRSSLDILDPAVGDGSLILALLAETPPDFGKPIRAHLFDTNRSALGQAVERVRAAYPHVEVDAVNSSFLDYALARGAGNDLISLARTEACQKYDLIIANPPYVRTQVMGAEQARRLSSDFGMSGRVDMYQAFVLAMSAMLDCSGTLGFIVSNRFMTTRGGSTLREALRTRTSLREVWDLGDTKLFDAAVLPAVIIATGDSTQPSQGPSFCSIYETDRVASAQTSEPLNALRIPGVVETKDGRRFEVRHGELRITDHATDVWCLASDVTDDWLGTVHKNTWRRFGEIGKVRVGVKTCADKVFIRSDWHSTSSGALPELLRPLTTHHGAGRYRAKVPAKPKAILYPHESVGGYRRATDLAHYPAG